MLGFLIHHKTPLTIIRVPLFTKSFLFGLQVRHIRMLMHFELTDFAQLHSTFEWSLTTFLSEIEFSETLPFIHSIRKLHDYKFINYFQFWSLRAQYLNNNPRQLTPFMRLIPVLSLQVVTRFYEISYFTHFLSLIFLYSNWSPLLRWKIFNPNIVTLNHFYEWLEGPFCHIKLN